MPRLRNSSTGVVVSVRDGHPGLGLGWEPVDGSRPEVAVPRRRGPGSGRDAWAAYAQTHDVDVGGLGRDEIIATLEDEGVLTD